MKKKLGYAIVVVSLSTCGCASLKPRSGFEQVEHDVSERSGLKVRWNSGSPADEETDAEIASLLAEELTAEKAMQIAMLNNRELQAIYEELNIAQADLVQAGLLRNPVFNGDLRFGTTGSGTGVDLGVAQDFISLLFIPLRKAQAGAAFEAAKLRVTGAVLDMAGKVRTAFYDAQASEELREMRQTVLDATQASFDLAKRLRKAGNIRDLDVSNERALYEQSKIDLAMAEAETFANRERLNELMGLWGSQTQWKAAPRLPTISSEELQSTDVLERQAVERSLDLQLARREVEIAARSLGIARPMSLLNELNIGIAAEREVKGDSKRNNKAILGRDITRSLVAGNSAGRARIPEGEPSKGVSPGWSFGPSMSIGIPLFDQGQAGVASATARLRQAAERYIALAVRIRAQLRARYIANLAAHDRAIYYERILLPLRQKIVEETQLQYNAMQASAFQLLQAKRDQINAGSDYIESLHSYWITRAQLDLLVNGRLSPDAQGESAMDRSSLWAGDSNDGGSHGAH